MIKRSMIILCLPLMLLMLTLGCHSTKQASQEDLQAQCCQECLDAFSQSPVGVGAAGAKCGEFTTGQPLSQACRDYFKKNPMVVADCE